MKTSFGFLFRDIFVDGSTRTWMFIFYNEKYGKYKLNEAFEVTDGFVQLNNKDCIVETIGERIF